MGWAKIRDALNPVEQTKKIGSGISKVYKKYTKEAARFSKKIDEQILSKIMPDALRGYHKRIVNMTLGAGPIGGFTIDYEQAEMEGKDGWLAVRQSMTQHVANAAIVFGAFYVGGAFAGSAALGEGTIGAAAVEGAGVGAGLGAGTTAASGGNLEEIGDAAWKGGLAGAAGGAVGGALGPASSTLGAAAQGAAVGAVGNATNTALNGGSGGEILGSGLSGAAVGGVAGAANYGLRDAAAAPASNAPSADTTASVTPTSTTADQVIAPAETAVARPNIGDQSVSQISQSTSNNGVADGGWMKKIGEFAKSSGGGQVLAGGVQVLGSGLANAMQPQEETEEDRLRRRQEAMSLDGVDISNDFTSNVQPYQVPDLIDEYNKFLKQRGF